MPSMALAEPDNDDDDVYSDNVDAPLFSHVSLRCALNTHTQTHIQLHLWQVIKARLPLEKFWNI